ncbi:17473_t:CDS:2, partial [Acaulospora morrowiae]
NLSYTGVSMKILKINPSGSLNIQVSSKKKIKDIVLWAEYRGKSEKEQHIGTFRSIVGHAYLEGCDGPYNSTITNYKDLDNTSQIIYEWDPPPGTKVVLKHGLAFLEGESVKFHVFTLDKPIYIKGRFSPLDTSLTDPSTLSEGESTDTEVYVSSFDSQPTSSSQSSRSWNGRGLTAAISFLITGMLIL